MFSLLNQKAPKSEAPQQPELLVDFVKKPFGKQGVWVPHQALGAMLNVVLGLAFGGQKNPDKRAN